MFCLNMKCLLPLLLSLLTLFTVSEGVSVLEFSSARYEAHEGDGIVSIIIRRSGDIEGDITVDVILRDITATGENISVSPSM